MESSQRTNLRFSRRPGALLLAALLMGARFSGTVAPAQSTNAPIIPRYQIVRYELLDSSLLSPADVAGLTGDATGKAVTIAEIRRALTRLQSAYRELGYRQAALTLPQQSLTNGIVQVRVQEGPSATQPKTAAPPSPPGPLPELPAWTAPAYDIRHFEIYGNTKLTPDEIDRILGPAAGPLASLDDLQEALVKLREAYRERGLKLAAVTLPQQLLTDGTIVIQVNEGWDPEAEALAKAQTLSSTNPPATPAERTFEVRHYEVQGNTLLREDTIEAITTPGTGTNVTFTQVRKVLGELQLAYRERGFVSASVALPQQQLTNATIRIQVTEGVLVEARVTGNRYFSSNNVMRALPSVANAVVWKDEVVNSRVLQRELDLANQNRDRQIYPVINPGPEPGTTALELRVKDRLPLHGRLELNNQSTTGTPDWRLNASLNYNNLWQLDNAVGVFYGFTPEEFKQPQPDPDYFFNRPLVANFGAYYRIPFGATESVQERINEGGNFGYNEATKQFRLPPPGSRADLTFSVSGSSSDTGVNYGPTTVVSQTPLLTILSRDSGQELTTDQSAGLNLNLPRALSDTRRINFSLGMDSKRSGRESYNTNNFLIVTVITNSQGSQIITSEVSSPQPTRHTDVSYLPLNFGMGFSDVSPKATVFGSVLVSANGVGDNADFVALSYSPDAQAEYAKAYFTLNYDRKLFRDWSLLLRGNAQAATGPLINNEQFALGGVNSVRGYYEGDEYGDVGWFASAELRTPHLNTEVAVVEGVTPVWLRGSVFLDAGQAFYLDHVPWLEPDRFLWSTGFGLSANINNHIDVKLTVGWPLADSANTQAYQPRVHFALGGQF